MSRDHHKTCPHCGDNIDSTEFCECQKHPKDDATDTGVKYPKVEEIKARIAERMKGEMSSMYEFVCEWCQSVQQRNGPMTSHETVKCLNHNCRRDMRNPYYQQAQ